MIKCLVCRKKSADGSVHECTVCANTYHSVEDCEKHQRQRGHIGGHFVVSGPLKRATVANRGAVKVTNIPNKRDGADEEEEQLGLADGDADEEIVDNDLGDEKKPPPALRSSAPKRANDTTIDDNNDDDDDDAADNVQPKTSTAIAASAKAKKAAVGRQVRPDAVLHDGRRRQVRPDCRVRDRDVHRQRGRGAVRAVVLDRWLL